MKCIKSLDAASSDNIDDCLSKNSKDRFVFGKSIGSLGNSLEALSESSKINVVAAIEGNIKSLDFELRTCLDKPFKWENQRCPLRNKRNPNIPTGKKGNQSIETC